MTDIQPTMVISASVVTADQHQAARAAEVLARAAVGLALEGIFVSVSMSQSSDEDEPHP